MENRNRQCCDSAGSTCTSKNESLQKVYSTLTFEKSFEKTNQRYQFLPILYFCCFNYLYFCYKIKKKTWTLLFTYIEKNIDLMKTFFFSCNKNIFLFWILNMGSNNKSLESFSIHVCRQLKKRLINQNRRKNVALIYLNSYKKMELIFFLKYCIHCKKAVLENIYIFL